MPEQTQQKEGAVVNTVTDVPEKRKTRVTLGVTRSLNTAQFENLEITLSAEDEISWGSRAERDAKVEKLTGVLADEYTAVQRLLLDRLGIKHKPGWFKEAPNPIKQGNFGDDL